MKKSKKILAGTMMAGAFVMQSAIGSAQPGVSLKPVSDATIRPFSIRIPQTELDELKRRILATRWPEKETSLINRKVFR